MILIRADSSKGSVNKVCKHYTSKHQRKGGIYEHVSICAAAENMWKLAETHLHDEHTLQHVRRKDELNT